MFRCVVRRNGRQVDYCILERSVELCLIKIILIAGMGLFTMFHIYFYQMLSMNILSTNLELLCYEIIISCC